MNAPSYAGTTKIVGGDGMSHLGGNIKEGDPCTFCPKVWDYMIYRFCINSVMDLGSGTGNAADYFFRKGLRTIAIEGLHANIAISHYPAICHDLTSGPVITNVDLVHCQEVVEHIDERFLGNLLSTLACGRVILLTHALPGQGGHHHVNEQSSDYWIKHISDVGYNLLIEDSNRVRNLAAQDRAIYLQNSGLIFHRR